LSSGAASSRTSGVDVLELVDADVLEARLPARPHRRVGLEQLARADYEVVEVDRAPRAKQLLIDPQHRLPIVRRRPALHLPGREPRVELRGLRQRDRCVRGGCAASRGAQQRQAIGQDVRSLAGVEQHLASEGMERPDLDARGVGDQRAEAPFDAGGEVERRIAVEGHDADPCRGHTARQQDRQPGDHRRRLAAAGRGDDLGGSIGQGRGGALLGIERGQDRRDVDGWRCADGSLHRSMLARRRLPAAYQPLTGDNARPAARLRDKPLSCCRPRRPNPCRSMRST
jgi:hypothetical protein